VKHPVTPDGRYFGVCGRLCRMAKPDLDEADRADLVGRLMAARRAVRDPKKCRSEADATGLRVSKTLFAVWGVYVTTAELV
jgi:hypothetical protein